MKLTIKPGKYVVAVSGGVDSMVLLDALRQIKDLELIVAHYDHGIRGDSAEDRTLVQATAQKYHLAFDYEAGRLGKGASEAVARRARYGFLERVREKYGARAIITAHHQDDLLETAILNILRGTGRKGLSALKSHDHIVRPMLHVSKADISAYAKARHVKWREDSTNADDTYLRNYVRHQLLPRFDADAKKRLLHILEGAQTANRVIDAELQQLATGLSDANTLDRQLFSELPHDVAKEVLAGWLRQQGIADFDRHTLERIVVAAKTKAPGARVDVIHGTSLLITREQLALRVCER